jgi:hypothetical protein
MPAALTTSGQRFNSLLKRVELLRRPANDLGGLEDRIDGNTRFARLVG